MQSQIQQSIEVYSPHQENYTIFKKVRRIGRWFQYALALFTLLPLVASSSKIKELMVCFYLPAVILYTFTIVATIVSEMYFHVKSDQELINSIICDAYDIPLCGSLHKNYYTNKNIGQGIERLAVNIFESAYWTNKILNKMMQKEFMKFFVLLIILITLAGFGLGQSEWLFTLFQSAFICAAILDFSRFLSFSSKVNIICEDLQIFYSTRKDNGSLSNESKAILMRLIMKYIAIRSWAMIELDSKFYLKNREQITKDWEEFKLILKIS